MPCGLDSMDTQERPLHAVHVLVSLCIRSAATALSPVQYEWGITCTARCAALCPCACACAGADGLFMVVDERGVFKDDSFQAAVAALQDGNAAAATAQSGKGSGKGDKKQQPKQVWTRSCDLAGLAHCTLLVGQARQHQSKDWQGFHLQPVAVITRCKAIRRHTWFPQHM